MPAAELSRRSFLAPWKRVRQELERLPGFLRPPGAVSEEAFVRLCERCGKCREACPVDAILPLGPAYGKQREGTPVILPRGTACELCEDLPCAAACPTGALEVIPRLNVRMGEARVNGGLCFAAQGQPCDYCVKHCPVGPAAIRLVEAVPRVELEACTGCGQCEHICPATPAAITVTCRT
jgi:ferredoxin-type protein NapG